MSNKFLGIWCNHVTTCPTCYRGTCQVNHGDAKCVCEAGWFLSDCRKHNCNGNGYSEVVNGQAVCKCHNGWYGSNCHTDVEADSILQVESETQVEAHVEVETDDQVKIGEIQDRPIPVCNPGFSGPNCNTVVCTDRCWGYSCRIINNYAYCYTNIQKPVVEEKFLQARRMKSNAKTPVLSILFPAIFVILT